MPRRQRSTLHGRDRTVHLLFDIGLIGKAVDGILEIIGGVGLFLFKPEQLNAMVRALTQHELSTDPADRFANLLVQGAHNLSSGSRSFAAIFLLWHGVVKVALVWALVRRSLWAYPTAMAAFGAFVLYQTYRYTHTRSAWLLALTLLDIIIIWITWLEYQRLRREGGRRSG